MTYCVPLSYELPRGVTKHFILLRPGAHSQSNDLLGGAHRAPARAAEYNPATSRESRLESRYTAHPTATAH
eukprot:scaffold324365_cov113-Tisochrysis_lutea.AAC.2